MTCDEVRDAAAEYALDIIEPGERAAVVAHIDCCSDCRHELVRVQRSADQLLDLRDPPDKYPVEVWAASLPRPARRRFRMIATLTAAALLVVGSAFGAELSHPATDGRDIAATASFTQDGKSVGRVDIYTGSPQVIVMSLRGVQAKGEMTCELVTSDATIGIGSFKLFKGVGFWSATLKQPVLNATALQLVNSSGNVVAVADLSSLS